MRKLVLILLTFIAVVTFIRAFDEADDVGRMNGVDSELSGERR